MGGGEDGVEEGAVVLQEFLVESRFVVESSVVAVEIGPVGEQGVAVCAAVALHCHMGVVGVCLFAGLVGLFADGEGLGDVFACDNFGEVMVCDLDGCGDVAVVAGVDGEEGPEW